MVRSNKFFVGLGLVFILPLLIFAGTSVAKDQTTCPVMGGLINKSIYADYQGSRVYFCCPPCLREVKEDPDKYVKKLKEQGVTLARSPD